MSSHHRLMDAKKPPIKIPPEMVEQIALRLARAAVEILHHGGEVQFINAAWVDRNLRIRRTPGSKRGEPSR
jgi:16S rRNA G1207 methylase RsmC